MKDKGNFEQYRTSGNLFERAACWAVTASWLNADDFQQAQKDAEELLALANPPLAEVEGYVDKVELPYLVQEDGDSWTLPTIMKDNKGWENGAVLVTVTIRKKP